MTARLRRPDVAWVMLGLLLIATSILRVTLSANRLLWLDETATGMIVMQPTLADFVHECASEVNGPLYNMLAYAWAHVSGVSNQALRALPAVFGIAAPLIALGPRSLMDRGTKFTWCALIACWAPGIWQSHEARPYTLILALGVANTVAFANLLRTPTLRAAWLWTGLSALLVLSHYFGGVLVAIQGLTFLVVRKRRALATWPAAIAFLPVLATIGIQARNLLAFSTPGTGWIVTLTPWDAVYDVCFFFGVPLAAIATLVWLAAAAVLRLAARRFRRQPGDAAETELWLTAACSLAAATAVIAIAFFRPILVDRYLTPYVPGILLGLTLCARRLALRWPLEALVLVAIFAISTAQWAMKRPLSENVFGWEAASSWLMTDHPRHVVFLWDNPMNRRRGAAPGLGGFFFARAGVPVSVDSIPVPEGRDPNPQLIAHAAPPGSVILWIYDLGVRGTAARTFPPRIQQLDPRWNCRNFGVGSLGVLACELRNPDTGAS